MRRLAVLAAVAALILAACGGNGEDEPSADVSGELAAAAQGAADSALLTLDDLPEGWTSAPADEEEDDDSGLDLSEECQDLVPEDVPGKLAEADSDEFTGPEDQQLSSSATIYDSEGAAEDAMRAADEFIGRCQQEMEEAFRELIESEAGADPEGVLEGLDVTVSELPVPALGDESIGLRFGFDLTLDSLTAQFAVDFVGLRQGKVLGGIKYLSLSEAAEEEEMDFAGIVADKLKAANDALPD